MGCILLSTSIARQYLTLISPLDRTADFSLGGNTWLWLQHMASSLCRTVDFDLGGNARLSVTIDFTSGWKSWLQLRRQHQTPKATFEFTLDFYVWDKVWVQLQHLTSSVTWQHLTPTAIFDFIFGQNNWL